MAVWLPVFTLLLIDNIPDAQLIPSALHRKLLRLPWRDVFTTNYDTLLERASYELTEKSFTVVACKEDLIGSADTARIVKLHGSFPSQRPFIITAEDYRTYPRTFAPFVNTVQQSLLENTLCLIGFSGDDPNFNQWIGWIRDNLGVDNAPQIYMLIHQELSEGQKRLLSHKKVTPVNIALLAPGQPARTQYEAALDYLLQRQTGDLQEKWPNIDRLFDVSPKKMTIAQAAEKLYATRKAYPGWLVVPHHRKEALDVLREYMERVLIDHLYHSKDAVEGELAFLYEYDWLREKCLRPPFQAELHIYKMVLERNNEAENLQIKLSIQLSLMRDLRESGEWDNWNTLRNEMKVHETALTIDDQNRLRYEECLSAIARFEFEEVQSLLTAWGTAPHMPQWTLRKAGLLTECGQLLIAKRLLEEPILRIRRQLAQRNENLLFLLSVESALMSLQSYITQALHEDTDCLKEDQIHSDARSMTKHYQHRVDWNQCDRRYIDQLEPPYIPFTNATHSASFDFGRISRGFKTGEDKGQMQAFAFLRFREETGHAFRIGNVTSGVKAAQGAAERLAHISRTLSLLTLVRADDYKGIDRVLTRALLSQWTMQEADRICLFYIEALKRTLPELTKDDWFSQSKAIINFAAYVLPEVLSRLCCKCSLAVLRQMMDLLETIYKCDQRLCYHNISSLTERLIKALSKSERILLIPRFLDFPMFEKETQEARMFPSPIEYLKQNDYHVCATEEQVSERIEALLNIQNPNLFSEAQNRLLFCFLCGMLTDQQATRLGNWLWQTGSFCTPPGWARTICLELSPPHVNPAEALRELLINETKGYVTKTSYSNSDFQLLNELIYASQKQIFRKEDISNLLEWMQVRQKSLLGNLAYQHDLFGLSHMALQQLYQLAEALLYLTIFTPDWKPLNGDNKRMGEILKDYEDADIRHCGLRIYWGHMLGGQLDTKKEIGGCLQSSVPQHRLWAYYTLITDLRNPKNNLLSSDERQESVRLLAQQIMWGSRQHIVSAINVASIIASEYAQLLGSEELEQILSGLSQMLEETKILADDSVEQAEEKGSIRSAAYALAKKLRSSRLSISRPDILEAWEQVSQDPNEFSEIRNIS